MFRASRAYLAAVKCWLAYLLLCLFSVQALPARELGKLVFEKEWSAEADEAPVNANGEDKAEDSKPKSSEALLPLMPQPARLRPWRSDAQCGRWFQPAFPPVSLFKPEIVVPPPDFY